MHLPSLIGLPPAILLLCASSAAADELQWPHNLPKHSKYFPEDEVHVRRSLNIQERLKREAPIGVKKMSNEEGEMFMLDNWIFASDQQHPDHQKRSGIDHQEQGNVTGQLESPLRPLVENIHLNSFLTMRARDMLMQRGFKCPAGTSDCSSIGQPNSCCGSASSCISIEDTGLGPVGCCPGGQTCGGRISCDTESGYSSCPESPNGGCCLPGFSCMDVGCVAIATSVTYVQPPTSTTSTRFSISSLPSPPPSSPPSPSSTSTPYTCSTGWFSCPASLSGGCCQNGRICASGASCIGSESSSTMAPVAPIRPTSASGTVPAPVTTSSISPDMCPIGFYVCEAYFPSGCCRIGRDCKTTGSCAPASSTTIINTNGVTIIAPTGASVATQGGSCPSAWYSCAASLGGNCCPDGFSCGDQCTATAGSSVADKVAPSIATTPSMASVWVMISLAFLSGSMMIIL